MEGPILFCSPFLNTFDTNKKKRPLGRLKAHLILMSMHTHTPQYAWLSDHVPTYARIVLELGSD